MTDTSRQQTSLLQTRVPKVAVVLATYNRCETALRCLELLSRQTLRPERVYVVDNGSRDGTANEVRKRFGEMGVIQLIELKENLGNAGGIRIGMEAAFAAGADAIWILDDDAWPRPDALEELLRHYSPEHVLSSLVVDPKKNDLSWACVLMGRRPEVVDTIRDLPAKDCFEVRGAWLGALIPREVVAEAGFPDAGFFIRGEDEEYPLRIARLGRRFFCVRKSLLEHPAPQNILRFQFLGRNFFYEPGLAPWKAYYVVRNRACIHRRFADTLIEGWFKAWASVFFFVLMAIAVDDRKWRRTCIYFKAGWRGFRGQLGMESRPG